jgi:8-oxo-dGTP pyrophosphatase MutT (NUDIX family)
MVTEQTGDMGDSPATDAVVAIVQRRGEFLFVKRSEACGAAVGYWTPVSGRIEAGESQEEACAREVLEEVGLRVVATAKLGELPILEGRFVLHYWTTEILGGEASIASPEVAALIWARLDELRQLTPTFEDDLRMIEEAERG